MRYDKDLGTFVKSDPTDDAWSAYKFWGVPVKVCEHMVNDHITIIAGGVLHMTRNLMNRLSAATSSDEIRFLLQDVQVIDLGYTKTHTAVELSNIFAAHFAKGPMTE